MDEPLLPCVVPRPHLVRDVDTHRYILHVHPSMWQLKGICALLQNSVAHISKLWDFTDWKAIESLLTRRWVQHMVPFNITTCPISSLLEYVVVFMQCSNDIRTSIWYVILFTSTIRMGIILWQHHRVTPTCHTLNIITWFPSRWEIWAQVVEQPAISSEEM